MFCQTWRDLYVLVAILKKIEYNLNDNVGMSYINTSLAFYATSFDSIAYTAACYSYKELGENEHPHKLIELLWCLLLIVLPIALVFSESSMNNIQSISIISAFPIGIIMIVMIISFFKDLKSYIIEKDKSR